MSSFHTVPYAAYWSSHEDETHKTVEGAGHEPAATTYYGGGTNAPIAVSLNLLRDNLWEVTHVSQAQDLDHIFAPVLDDLLPIGNVSLGELGATNAGAFNPFVNPQGIPEAHGYMNAVCTHHLFFNRGHRIKTLRCSTLSTLGSRRHHAGYILPWLLLVLIQRNALTEPNAMASTPNDPAWAGLIFPPLNSVIEPLGVSATLPSTKAILTLTPR
jgi:hypothetical protein